MLRLLGSRERDFTMAVVGSPSEPLLLASRSELTQRRRRYGFERRRGGRRRARAIPSANFERRA